MRYTTYILCLISVVWVTQAKSEPFTNKDYPGYIATLSATLGDRPAFPALVQAAIALEKTKGWDGAGKPVTEALAKQPDAARWLATVRKLLGEDTAALPQLFAGNAPDRRDVLTAARLCKEHGFPVAANCLTAVSPDEPGLRVVALLSLPAAKRPPVEALLLKQASVTELRDLGIAARQLYVKAPPEVTLPPQDFLDLAAHIMSPEAIYSFDTVNALRSVGKKDEAIKVVYIFAALRKENVDAQLQAASFLWMQGNYAETDTFYRTAITTMTPPYARPVRLAYIAYLKWLDDAKRPLANGHTAAAALTDPDPLLAGDALVCAGNFQAAGDKFAAIFLDKTQPLARRLDACNGLLDCEPGYGLAGMYGLSFDVLALPDQTTREHLLVWIGQQYNRVTYRAVGYREPAVILGNPPPPAAAPLRADSPAALVKGYGFLVKYFPLLCLRTDLTERPQSLRLGMAYAYALNRQPAEAAEILYRRVSYQLMPPPDGWKMFDGRPEPNAFTPKDRVTPTALEYPDLTKNFLERIDAVGNAHEAPLWPELVRQLAPVMATAKTKAEYEAYMGSLATILSSAVVALDPPPVDSRQPRPAREIDMAKVTPLMEAITPIFTNDAVASNSVPFILDGVIYGMRITHDPKLQEALFALLNTTADRFLATSKDPFKLESFRPFIITRLEEGKREDLKAYGKKLREKYLPKP